MDNAIRGSILQHLRKGAFVLDPVPDKKRKRSDSQPEPTENKRARTDIPKDSKTELKRQLNGYRKKIEEICSGNSRKSYKGGGVPLSVNESIKEVSSDNKKKVNDIGTEHKCHSCKERGNDVWIADHIPPRHLTRAKVQYYWNGKWDGKYRFFPHCQACAECQSGIVSNIKRTPLSDLLPLDRNERLMIVDTRKNMSNVGHAGKPSTTDRANIQPKGIMYQCHTCGKGPFNGRYVADHVPPREFNTPYMKSILKALGIEIREPTARPQCRNCSNKQGGQLKAFSEMIIEIAKSCGFIVYK